MGKQGKNTAKKKAARQEAKETELLKRGLPARLDALLAKAQEETKHIDLFADPPPPEMCPICAHPHQLTRIGGKESSYVHSCCGKEICRACQHASELATDKINRRKQQNKEPIQPYTCAFCRETMPNSPEEEFESRLKRMAPSDGESILALGFMHREGVGTPKSEAKPRLLTFAASLLSWVLRMHFAQ